MDAHKYLDDDGETKTCGDGEPSCPECYRREEAYWAAHFGVTASMSREERRAQLERFAPPGEPKTREQLMAEFDEREDRNAGSGR